MTARPFDLTDRQVQILALVAEGLSNAEIGKRLWIEPATAKTHMNRIAKQMGCGDRAGMVALAYQAGVLRIPDRELMRQADELVARVREQRLEKVRADLLRQQGQRGAA